MTAPVSHSPLRVLPLPSGGYEVASTSTWPLRTPTLPPAEATNTVFVGSDHPLIVDPATPHGEERQRLRHLIKDRRHAGRPPTLIVLTHHHRDHVGAAAWLRDTEHLPIAAHPRTAELLPELRVDRLLEEGDLLAPSDDDAWQVLHTPGHASGHIALWQPESRVLIGGDLLASIGTIIIDPPDGHMATYLATLRRIRDLDPAVIIPSHGAPITDPERLINQYLEHRAMRESLVFDALTSTPTPLFPLTERAYPGLARPLLPLATRSALAHLQSLRERGAAHVDGPELAPTSLWRRA
jgi:ribonuclease/clavin/mitogillin